jgi:hypothetical protein
MDSDQFDASRFERLVRKSGICGEEKVGVFDETNLGLPAHLEILCQQTNALITSLLSLRRRRVVCTFQKVKEIVERQTLHSFTERTLGQVLRMLPEQTLKTEWFEDRRRILPHELRIELVTTKGIEEILGFAHKYLIEFVKIFHDDFLRSIGEHVTNVREWHSRFDLKSVPPVTPVELPRPVIVQQPTIEESLRAALPKHESVSVIPSSLCRSPMIVPKSCANLSSYFTVAKRIEEKEALNEQLAALAAMKRSTNVLSMSDFLNAFFQSKRKRCLPISEILSSASMAQQFRDMEGQKLIDLIEEVKELSEGYFRTIEVRGVVYLQTEPESMRTYQIARGPIVRACMGEPASFRRLEMRGRAGVVP